METTKLLHIFKPGRHTTRFGQVIEFSEADLAATARAYDPALHKAPLVIGHPALDDPAQGWAKSLAVQPKGLYAEPMQVDAEFGEAVNAGRYGAISAKFYRPDEPSNPVPGVWYLRHIGFLGAFPPAVKGLDAPEFAEEDGCVSFCEPVEFSGWAEVQNASLWRRLREWIIGKHGLAEADNVIPDYTVASLEDEARREEAPAPAFSEPPPSTHQETPTVTPEEAAALERSNNELKQQLQAMQDQAAAARAKQQQAANAEFCESLTGKLKPEQRQVVLATLNALEAQASPVEFGEGDAKQPLPAALKAALSDLPDLVEFAEVATKDKALGSATGAGAEFAESRTDPARLSLHQKAKDLAAKERISYEDAVRRLVNQ